MKPVMLIFLCVSQLYAMGEYKVTDQVFFDVTVDDAPLGRLVFGLFGEIVPKTTRNFITIATEGINGKTYAGTTFHRIIKRFMIQGGDILANNGSGTISIHGDMFEDENFDATHDGPGFLSMANSGPNTNGCQFFITTIATHWLDGQHTVFGKVLEGQTLVHKIERIKTDPYDRPKQAVVIAKCGMVPTSSPFYVSAMSYNFMEVIRAGALPLTMSFSILAFFQYIIYKLRKFEKLKIHSD
ncbi:hypothetical protein PPYR_08408 [Photinus pyralis]|uniref:Peptidyl-prolyl cis-trans isomerase n=1 Tax=Photinus pyralis TaxID=7054 RepID=A0A5N4AJC7_PHOPY|nr:peptidyl-prolyl cis-trans isomerase-like [Photinus pyralis]KAB0797414.1 hypothetical protein PPYR_08408 [Photinus pyralis]